MGNRFKNLCPGVSVVKHWKHNPLAPHWKGPHAAVLTSPTAAKVAAVTPWIHRTRVRRAYHTDPEDVKRTTQKDPTGPCETKIIFKKK